MLFDFICWCVDFSVPIRLVIVKPLLNRLLISPQPMLVARHDKAIDSAPLRRNWETDLGLAKAGMLVLLPVVTRFCVCYAKLRSPLLLLCACLGWMIGRFARGTP